MDIESSRALYYGARVRLRHLVARRNQLLHVLGLMVRLADTSPDMGRIAALDIDAARAVLNQIDELTPLITAGIEEVNRLAEQTGSPCVEWQNSTHT